MRDHQGDATVHAGELPDIDIEVGAEELRANLSDLLSKVAYGERRVLVTRHGAPLAVILPVADAIHYAELVDADDRAASAASLAEPGESTPHEQVMSELGLR